MKLALVAASAAMVVLGCSRGATAQCGDVTMAEMNWTTAELTANVDKLILENGFGCSVQLVPGDTVPTAKTMSEQGHPDVAPEVLTSNTRVREQPRLQSGLTAVLGELPVFP
jgi:glycine betaine/proline transport system substrate-binding protein